MPKKKIKIPLLENALDFMLSATEHLGEDPFKESLKNAGFHLETKSEGPTERNLKYAVLHLQAGVELILKERLRREHWSLVFEKTERANQKDYESGDFESVRIHTCIKRLEGICGVSLKEDHAKSLEDLRKKRNKLEHFGINDNVDSLKSVSYKVLSILIDFINTHFNPEEFGDAEWELFEEIKDEIAELKGFVEHRLSEIRKDIEEATKSFLVVDCPRCYQKAMVLGDEKPKCLFCHYEDDPSRVAEQYIESIQGISSFETIKDGGVFPQYECPECEQEAFINLSCDMDSDWVCFGCGYSWDTESINFCMECYRPFVVGDEPCGVCYDCIKRKIEDD